MNQLQIFTPILPYVGHLPGELRYGSRIKVRGHFREPENIVHIILQKEALLNPQDDLPLYITIHPGRKEIIRNHLCSDCSTGGQEERVDNCPIECGQDFELTIAPTSVGYEILLHGSALHTFSYRTPLAAARYLFVSSGCVIFAINFENLNETASDHPHQPQQPTPPLQAPQLYPMLEQHHKQRQTQQPRPHHHQHHHHSNNNLRELVLQVLPLVQLAASQLQANANSAPARINDANILTACSMGLMRLFRFLTIACVFGYVGYVFSRNIGISWK
uniref:Galectin n=1 Tax=Anopheles farauti TaxID=69004 RepID=A0A182Q9R5_9DIPT